jgi:hypothetical protein
MTAIVLESLLTCPRCGFAKLEMMPTDAYQRAGRKRNATTDAAIGHEQWESGRLLRSAPTPAVSFISVQCGIAPPLGMCRALVGVGRIHPDLALQ